MPSDVRWGLARTYLLAARPGFLASRLEAQAAWAAWQERYAGARVRQSRSFQVFSLMAYRLLRPASPHGLAWASLAMALSDKKRDVHAEEIDALTGAVLGECGGTDPSTRDAAFRAGSLPPVLEAFVEKVRRDSATIADSDITRLRTNGYSEDDIFEITIAAALGAAVRRLDAGLRAMAPEV